jgi:hypothetical protein
VSDPPVVDNGLPPGFVWAGAGYIDCSPEAIARKLAQLDALRQQYYGGVQSVGDRGRSVTYQSMADLVAAINSLQGEISFCTTGAWPRAGSMRSFVIPQVKGL